MTMPPLPPGFVLEGQAPKPAEKKRKIQFDWAPGTPPEVIAAAEASAATERQPQAAPPPSAGPPPLPPGFSLMGPGVGRDSPKADNAGEFVRANQGPNEIDAMISGGLAGPYQAGLGTAQLGAHLSLPMQAANYGFNLAGKQGPIDRLDAEAQRMSDAKASDPAAQTMPFRVAEFVGGMAATSPLAALSIPAKGTAAIPALLRAGAAGGAVAATTPVAGDNFVLDKSRQVAGGAALGAGLTGLGRGAMWTAERLYAPNTLASLANVPNSFANRTQYAKDGEQLAKDTGVRMTPGQVSGSKVQTGLENMSRQSIFSADRAFQADKKVAEDAVHYVNGVMDRISKNPASEAAIGTQIQAITSSAVTKIAAQREKIAAQEYGAIDQALGNRAFVTPTNAMREADAIIREYSGVVTPEAARIVKQAQELKAKLAQKQAFTFREAQANRGYYGKGAKGSTNVFDDVAPNINRTIATRLFKAFDADMEASAAQLSKSQLGPGMVPQGYFKGKVGGQENNGLGDAIKNANAHYREYSQLIEATESHPISRLFGEHIKIGDVVEFDKIAPEVVLNRLGQMHPSELVMVRNYMEKNGPEAWQQYKRLIVDRALEQARTLPTSAGANTVPFNAALFMRALGADKPDKIHRLQAVFSSAEFSEMDKAFQVARRLGDRFGYNGSGTGPYMEVKNFLDSIKQRSVQAVASSGGEVLGLRKVANVMLNAEGRRALIKLSTLPPQSRQAASLVSFLAALAVGQDGSHPDPNKASQRPRQ